MVRVKGKDDLGDAANRLKDAFARVETVRLATQAGPAAQAMLRDFFSAAENLLGHEKTFNARARKPGLLDHLRTPEHFRAMKVFASLRRELEEHNPEMAQAVIRLVENAGRNVAAPAPKAAAAKPSAQPRL